MLRTDGEPRTGLVGLRWLLLGAVWLAACNSAPRTIENNVSFKGKLSEYALFKGNMPELLPADGVVPIQIGSSLFTDYAEKQRLLKIPDGQKMVIQGDGLPSFPDGTLLAKTFYYSKSGKGTRLIVETRLLLYSGGKWNAATYRWNEAQTDAELLVEGATVPVYFEDRYGKYRHLEYKIPAQNDCGTCHRSGNELVPLGPQMRNLNIAINVGGENVNQLAYLMQRGVLAQADITGIASLPDYKDSSLALAPRARAYLEMNCAHCHREAGSAAGTSLDLSFNTPFEKTGMGYNKENMVIRMSTMGEYHMPKIGTTTPDEEGVRLIRDYIKGLAD
ncbi:putative repeat protein (TIGR03806 family) [Dyadobacter sp. BE34]|uniref:Repeat protein (TIGR03806 family) n=1 Tax=Dyadobacter fermentans TaxID=94254 RepID=A0ABU1R656_9BACT|nr:MULTISPECIES: c-type cytochrome [Dyadobacter]MDR6808893.1 putative repeat protein (TIGR03806 family) [Dyadobacter fermentans]MDR7046636.1 putative repeat protein (TIGR03806 family) [Dyadobacter sp. BE242]MDR7200950.1 putative repeat protein (TIGR03806 family) [Dyadobacter sp. BE34]MDR7218910.1 putative repeat protein (TIGR03806 family) [Dyadobacter sp. BE31]MDR7264880.1 putative repeat protein (TIGR03806 family) [Dyadobacter sp. BE32]